MLLAKPPPHEPGHPVPAVPPSSRACGLSPAWWPQHRPLLHLAAETQLRPPPGATQGWTHHRQRLRRLRASREPRPAGGAEAQSRRRGGRRLLRRTLGARRPACLAPSPPRGPPRALARGRSRRPTCVRLAAPKSGLPEVGKSRPMELGGASGWVERRSGGGTGGGDRGMGGRSSTGTSPRGLPAGARPPAHLPTPAPSRRPAQRPSRLHTFS